MEEQPSSTEKNRCEEVASSFTQRQASRGWSPSLGHLLGMQGISLLKSKSPAPMTSSY